MFFASDNSGPVHPKVMEALTRANEGYASSYGADDIMDRVRTHVRDIFEAPEAAVYLVATGTAANALSLSILANPWDAIYCHTNAHIEEDECGSPEFYTNGAKLTLIDGKDAKMDATTFKERAEATGALGVHGVQRGALSVTNVTERGTVHSLDEMRALTTIAKEYDIGCHLDGARFTNALVALGCTPAEMTWKSGFDVVSFGGTKNGLMGVEAVIIFDPAKAWEFELRRKRGAHLFSKHRYLSAQMEAYLTDGLWLELAKTANTQSAKLSAGVLAADGMLLHPTDANMVFAGWSEAGHKRAKDAGAMYYPWPSDQHDMAARLVCNWSTTDANIEQFVELISG